MNDDLQQLRESTQTGDDQAFKRVVVEHGGLVYNTALRRLNGDHALAEDAAQTVFMDLAAKAASLPDDTILPAWLHRQTRYVTSHQARTEERRRLREQKSAEDAPVQCDGPDVLWNEIKALIDEAISQLDERDQSLLILRFWKGKSLRETGAAAGLSENAAQKRITRSFEKLRSHLLRCGVSGSAATLILAISNNAQCAAAPAFASTIAAGASATHAQSPGIWSALNPWEWFAGIKTKPVLAAALSLIALSLGSAGFIAGRANAAKHHTATEWQIAVDQAAPLPDAAPMAGSTSRGNVGAGANQRRAAARSVQEIVQEAAAYFQNNANSSEARALAFVATRSLRIDQIDEAMKELESFRDDKSVFDGLGPILVGILAGKDLQSAFDYADAHFKGRPRDDAIRATVRLWAKQDPPAAWQWHSQTAAESGAPIQPDVWRASASDIFAQWAAADPAAAFSQLASVNPTEERSAISGIVNAALGSNRSDEIRELIRQMPDERRKGRLAEQLADD